MSNPNSRRAKAAQVTTDFFPGPILLDTGVIYALADTDDAWHDRAKEMLSTLRTRLVVPITVIPEATYLLRLRLGPEAERGFISSVASGEMQIADMSADLGRSAELMAQYPQIGFVDASLVAIAERFYLKRIATTDRRHFAAIRPRHIPAFELLP